MIPLPPSARIYLACGATDMRKGFDGLAVLVQQVLAASPHSGALFAFRGAAIWSSCSGTMARAVPVFQADGPGQICVAIDQDGLGHIDVRTAFHAAGRDRLATPGTHGGAVAGGLKIGRFVSVFLAHMKSIC